MPSTSAILDHPAELGTEELNARATHRRAVEAVIWGMPAVNYRLMYQEMVRKTNGGFNQVLYWPRLLDWRNQTLTPNPDVIYLMPFFNTKDVGPIVLEIPPADDGAFNGSIMDYWQAAIEDVGPGGVDKGKGAKYLVLPPGYDMARVPSGYIPMPLLTYQGYALLRSVLKSGSDADVAKAVDYGKRIKLYPLSQAANPRPTTFVDASSVEFDSTIQYDARFFESLASRCSPASTVRRSRCTTRHGSCRISKRSTDRRSLTHRGQSMATQPKPQASSGAITVTADNFIRAESDSVFTGLVKQGGFGKFYHNREVTAPESRIVQRPNRDTLYSTGVFDLDAGPVTISLPDAGKRFMTMIVIDEDHYVFTVVYGAGKYSFTRDKIGTRYAVAAIRILINPDDPEDVAQVLTLQDAVRVDQPGGPGKFEVPNWDAASHKKVRDALTTLGETIPDWNHSAGRKNEVDQVRHLIVTATGWGLNPEKDAIYLNVTPSKNDGTTVYNLIVKDVPVDGFWSISLYNAQGYFEPNNLKAYTLNNITAKKAADGSVAIQFGGCDAKIPNCLPITKGWNYMVRLYRPRAEVVSGQWKFPEAQAQAERADARPATAPAARAPRRDDTEFRG